MMADDWWPIADGNVYNNTVLNLHAYFRNMYTCIYMYVYVRVCKCNILTKMIMGPPSLKISFFQIRLFIAPQTQSWMGFTNWDCIGWSRLDSSIAFHACAHVRPCGICNQGILRYPGQDIPIRSVDPILSIQRVFQSGWRCTSQDGHCYSGVLRLNGAKHFKSDHVWRNLLLATSTHFKWELMLYCLHVPTLNKVL